MNLVLVGLNHKTAPVALREQFALAEAALHTTLLNLHIDLAEVVILSTCNRLEVYAAAESAEAAFATITAFLAGAQGISPDLLTAHLYGRQGLRVASHLMRVAAGLDSLMLGETQILGQVAQGLAQAQAANTSGPVLTRLFNDALHAGKRVQSETTISRHNISVSDAAVALLEQKIADLAAARVLLVGAGEMSELAALALQQRGVTDLHIVSRTDANAARLAERLGVQALSWNGLPVALSNADVVMTALRTASPVIDVTTFNHLGGAQPECLIVDIGVPRNVAPEVGALPGIRLHDIDDLQSAKQVQQAGRQAVIAQVETMCADAAESYEKWLHSRQVVPLITELRQQAEAVAELELEQALRRLPGLSADEQEIVAQMAHRIVNKLLHAPIVSLKERAAYGDHFEYSHAVRELFALRDDRMHSE